jgi:hypothetical protein
MGFLLHRKRFRVLEKKLTNSSPFRESVDKHSISPSQSTLAGIELMHMLRKGQLKAGVEQGLTAATQFYALAS